MAVGANGRETDTAVTHDDCGDPMPTRWADIGIPDDLTVIVGVNIDEPWGHEGPRGIDLLPARRLYLTDFSDDSIVYGYVGLMCGRAGAINNLTASYNEIVHNSAPLTCFQARRRASRLLLLSFG